MVHIIKRDNEIKAGTPIFFFNNGIQTFLEVCTRGNPLYTEKYGKIVIAGGLL